MPDDGFVREIVMRMADGSEFVFEGAQIDQVDVEYGYAESGWVPVSSIARTVASGRATITIKLHSDSFTWNVGKPPRDVTPRPARLPGRPPELPPHG